MQIDYIPTTINKYDIIPDDDVTQEDLRREFEYALDTWRKSACRNELLDIINSEAPKGGWRFRKIVCLATGSFSTRSTRIGENRFDTPGSYGEEMLQFACVIDTAHELKQRGHTQGVDLQLFFQDPWYSHIDRGLITGIGGTVLQSEPGQDYMGLAKDHLGRRTLLFEFCVDRSKSMWTDLVTAETGMHVGVPARVLRLGAERRERWRDEEPGYYLALIDRFDRWHTACEFPAFDFQPAAFRSLAVHWPVRRSQSL